MADLEAAELGYSLLTGMDACHQRQVGAIRAFWRGRPKFRTKRGRKRAENRDFSLIFVVFHMDSRGLQSEPLSRARLGEPQAGGLARHGPGLSEKGFGWCFEALLGLNGT